jgi:YD repeat-containing protein
LFTFLPLSFPVHAASPSYVYDDAGRLIAVIDPAGDTAVYSYDAVGNLLGITRQPSTTLAILNFTPKSSPIGTVVTIHGTGFDPTPSQNTVTFNGTTASVTSALTTQIVTPVPGGATSGPIGVTTPSGSTTSVASFTVTTAGAPTAPPTITSFTPTIGVPGTAVTITGANFSPTVTDNQAVFIATQALVTASTATTLTATTPSVRASGRITVATPLGAAVSADDFFIPPTPYTAADVSATGRMAIGQSQLVTLSTANKIGLLVFDGTVNQRLSIQATGSTLSWTTTLYDVPPDVTTPITPGGPAVTANLATPGQHAQLPFTGAVGQKAFLLINSSTVTNCSPAAFKLVRPNGSQIATGNVCAGTFIDTQTLTAAGTYTVVLDPSSANTGQVTVTVYDVVHVTDSITPGGPAVTATITTPGQDALLSFNGAAGQRVSLLVNSKTFPSCGNVRILKPDGSTLATVSGCANSFIDAQTLPVTRTYTVQIDPYGADTGQHELLIDGRLRE